MRRKTSPRPRPRSQRPPSGGRSRTGFTPCDPRVTSLAGIGILPATVEPESRKESAMIKNFNAFLGSVAQTDLGKAARRSARTIWNAHRAAFETTRQEAGKILVVAIDESQRFS